MCASMATGSIGTYRLNEVVDNQAPGVSARGQEKAVAVNWQQPSIRLFTFLCIENQGWAWVRVKGQPAEAWAGHVIGGPMAPGLGEQGSPRNIYVAVACYLVETAGSAVRGNTYEIN